MVSTGKAFRSSTAASIDTVARRRLGHGIAALLGLLLATTGLPIQEAAEELANNHTLPEGADLLSALDAERAAIEAVFVETDPARDRKN